MCVLSFVNWAPYLVKLFFFVAVLQQCPFKEIQVMLAFNISLMSSTFEALVLPYFSNFATRASYRLTAKKEFALQGLIPPNILSDTSVKMQLYNYKLLKSLRLLLSLEKTNDQYWFLYFLLSIRPSRWSSTPPQGLPWLLGWMCVFHTAVFLSPVLWWALVGVLELLRQQDQWDPLNVAQDAISVLTGDIKEAPGCHTGPNAPLLTAPLVSLRDPAGKSPFE